MSLRDRIISTDDIVSEMVEIPAWDVTVEVRSMSARARVRMMSRAAENDGELNMETLFPEIVVLCSYDPDTGERIFNDDDVSMLLDKSAGPIELLATAAMRVSGMTSDSLDTAGKDSPSTESDDSSSS